MRLCVLLILGIVGVLGDKDKQPEIKIPDGKIRGQFSTSYGGKTFIQFVGIPYATPPIAELRFEDPKPVKPWHGTWIANVTSLCLQVYHHIDPEDGTIDGSEDCLHLNVFIPGDKINPKAKYDVNVHIHGGAFMFGSKESYSGPKYIMDRNMILVSINYRVGVFGFLSTADANLPGNYGMKDQVLALKWVKNNIQYFGGNPDSITISGLSAGGASVHYHYLSPLSKGLYHRGISASGCALNPWAFDDTPRKQAKVIAKAVGCNDKDTKVLVKCLKTRTAEQLNEATKLLRSWLFNPFSPLGVVVDDKSKNPFLPEHPYKLLLDGKVNDVPWLVSATTAEGLYPAAAFAVKDEYFDDIENRWDQLVPEILHYTDTVCPKKCSAISKQIKEKYLGNDKFSRDKFLEFIQMVGDRLFVVGLEQAARLQSKANKSPVYYYSYDYPGDEMPTLATLFTGKNDKYGVCHGDDMMFIFSDMHVDEVPKMSKLDERMKDFLLDLWEQFTKTGKPNLENWIPVSKNLEDPIDYLNIASPDNIEMKNANEFGNRKYWDSLPFEENHNVLKKGQKIEL